MTEFLKVGFILKENIIKIQHNCEKTPIWIESAKRFNFLLIMHEHIFVFRKPNEPKETFIFKDSSYF